MNCGKIWTLLFGRYFGGGFLVLLYSLVCGVWCSVFWMFLGFLRRRRFSAMDVCIRCLDSRIRMDGR